MDVRSWHSLHRANPALQSVWRPHAHYSTREICSSSTTTKRGHWLLWQTVSLCLSLRPTRGDYRVFKPTTLQCSLPLSLKLNFQEEDLAGTDGKQHCHLNNVLLQLWWRHLLICYNGRLPRLEPPLKMACLMTSVEPRWWHQQALILQKPAAQTLWDTGPSEINKPTLGGCWMLVNPRFM